MSNTAPATKFFSPTSAWISVRFFPVPTLGNSFCVCYDEHTYQRLLSSEPHSRNTGSTGKQGLSQEVLEMIALQVRRKRDKDKREKEHLWELMPLMKVLAFFASVYFISETFLYIFYLFFPDAFWGYSLIDTNSLIHSST